jgi:hypothetical protein
MQDEYKDMVKKLTKRLKLPYQVKKYNRTSITKEDFDKWIKMFTIEFFSDSGFTRLSQNINMNTLENYVKMLVDKKLSLRFLNHKEVGKMKAIYSEISCFKQSTFPKLLDQPEFNYVLEELF